MPVIHGFKTVQSERKRSGFGWWKYAVSYCGLKDQIGDWAETFTKDANAITCKRCLKSISPCGIGNGEHN